MIPIEEDVSKMIPNQGAFSLDENAISDSVHKELDTSLHIHIGASLVDAKVIIGSSTVWRQGNYMASSYSLVSPNSIDHGANDNTYLDVGQKILGIDLAHDKGLANFCTPTTPLHSSSAHNFTLSYK